MESAEEIHCQTEHLSGKLLRFIKNLQNPETFLSLDFCCLRYYAWFLDAKTSLFLQKYCMQF